MFALGGYVLQRTLFQTALDRGNPLTILLVTFGLSVITENALLQAFTSNGQSINIGSLIAKSFNPSPVVSSCPPGTPPWLNSPRCCKP